MSQKDPPARFRQLKKRRLNQEVRKIKHKGKEYELDFAVQAYIDKGTSIAIQGITVLQTIFEGDCYEYAVGGNKELLLPGIYEHTGTPKRGEIIIYSSKITEPKHVGIWLGNNKVRSKLGNQGPIVEHPWDLIPTIYGNKAIFSTYKSNKL